MAKFQRLDNLTEKEFMTTIVRPAVVDSHGAIYTVDRESTAAESVKKFFHARVEKPSRVITMHAVGLKIEGRSSVYNLWCLKGSVYAVDVKDTNFVAKINP